jgi:DNA-directed RNA polymerase subunit beta'
LNTAVTGYLTRKLVEMGMEVWITMADCGTTESLLITDEESRRVGLPDMRSRIIGRLLAEAVADIPAEQMIDGPLADHLLSCGVSAVRVRSVLSCQAPYGVCQHCYGADLATGKLVRPAMAVGVIAGQSIGEPGTQLSMKAFHSGGIANAQGDIRAGLPRVIELFEARPPSPKAPLAHCSGVATIEQHAKTGQCIIIITPEQEKPWQCQLAFGQKPVVAQGQWVEMGTPLCNGAIDLREQIGHLGSEATARYLIHEVQRVFRATGVFLHDKHLECIVRQMLRYVQISDPGDTTLLPGQIIDRFQFFDDNRQIWAQGGHPATARPVIFGLTRAILQTSSWIAAASFQETSRVLTYAALSAQTDHLIGLKSRVIAGMRLPTSLPKAV